MSDKTRTTEVTVLPSTLSLLGIVFVTLKLTGNIDWSWWLVTMPFWFAPAVLLAIAGACFAVVGLWWFCAACVLLWRRAFK